MDGCILHGRVLIKKLRLVPETLVNRVSRWKLGYKKSTKLVII